MKDKVKITNKMDLTGLKKQSPSFNNGWDDDEKLGKRLAKGIVKIAAVGLVLCASITLSFKGNAYNVAVKENKLNFEEATYRQNINVAPGYYNAYPVKIYISGAFKESSINKIIEGIEYLDSQAVGIKFEYEIGHHITTGFDIYIHKAEFDSQMQAGEASIGKLDAGKIGGIVRLEETWDSQWLLTPLTVHELCHVLGLKHSKDLNSIMYPIMSSFRMSKEDIANVNTIYPDGDFEK